MADINFQFWQELLIDWSFAPAAASPFNIASDTATNTYAVASAGIPDGAAVCVWQRNPATSIWTQQFTQSLDFNSDFGYAGTAIGAIACVGQFVFFGSWGVGSPGQTLIYQISGGALAPFASLDPEDPTYTSNYISFSPDGTQAVRFDQVDSGPIPTPPNVIRTYTFDPTSGSLTAGGTFTDPDHANNAAPIINDDGQVAYLVGGAGIGASGVRVNGGALDLWNPQLINPFGDIPGQTGVILPAAGVATINSGRPGWRFDGDNRLTVGGCWIDAPGGVLTSTEYFVQTFDAFFGLSTIYTFDSETAPGDTTDTLLAEAVTGPNGLDFVEAVNSGFSVFTTQTMYQSASVQFTETPLVDLFYLPSIQQAFVANFASNQTIIVIWAPPFGMTCPLDFATVGKFYSHQILAFGGTAPYTYELTGGAFPPGLTMSPEGLLSGTPSKAGTYTYSVTATDSAALEDNLTCQLTVAKVGNYVNCGGELVNAGAFVAMGFD